MNLRTENPGTSEPQNLRTEPTNRELGTGNPGIRTGHSRMDGIQAPIVQVVGDLIREVPGTISLGQGVVHFGPPPAAVEAARAAMSNPATHEYQDGFGTPSMIAAIEEKLARDNGIDAARGTRLMVTAGGNMAFVHAIFAITRPGDEVILSAVRSPRGRAPSSPSRRTIPPAPSTPNRRCGRSARSAPIAV